MSLNHSSADGCIDSLFHRSVVESITEVEPAFSTFSVDSSNRFFCSDLYARHPRDKSFWSFRQLCRYWPKSVFVLVPSFSGRSHLFLQHHYYHHHHHHQISMMSNWHATNWMTWKRRWHPFNRSFFLFNRKRNIRWLDTFPISNPMTTICQTTKRTIFHRYRWLTWMTTQCPDHSVNGCTKSSTVKRHVTTMLVTLLSMTFLGFL